MNTMNIYPNPYAAELTARIATFRRAESLRRSNRRQAFMLAILTPWNIPTIARDIRELREDNEAERMALASFTISYVKPNPPTP